MLLLTRLLLFMRYYIILCILLLQTTSRNELKVNTYNLIKMYLFGLFSVRVQTSRAQLSPCIQII